MHSVNAPTRAVRIAPAQVHRVITDYAIDPDKPGNALPGRQGKMIPATPNLKFTTVHRAACEVAMTAEPTAA